MARSSSKCLVIMALCCISWICSLVDAALSDATDPTLSVLSRRTLTTISPTLAQPDSRDRVHTIWMNGPTYPTKLRQGTWPPFDSTGSISSSSACDPSRSGFTGYQGSTAHSGYCSPASGDFNTDPWHLLIHSGRLGVVLDAAMASGLIAKLGVVSELSASNSTDVYDALTVASLNLTLAVTKSSDAADPDQNQCTAGKLTPMHSNMTPTQGNLTPAYGNMTPHKAI